GAQDLLDAIERISLAAAVAQGLLLNPAPDVIYGLGAELHDVEGVQYGGGVGELVGDGGLVAGEGIQRRDLHTRAERLGSVGEPVGVGLLRPARHEIEQSGADLAFGVAGQVDHAGELLGTAAPHIDVVPDVLIDPEADHAFEAGLIG